MIQVVYGDGQIIICGGEMGSNRKSPDRSIIIYIGIGAFELFIYNVLYKLYWFWMGRDLLL
jgi:hypothetical protein